MYKATGNPVNAGPSQDSMQSSMGMNSTTMTQEQSTFDSTKFNYGSGNSQFNFQPTNTGFRTPQTQRPIGQSDGTLVGTSVSNQQPQVNAGPSFTNSKMQGSTLDEQIQNSWAKMRPGQALSQDELNYWKGKATNPDTYSDQKIRVGWNPYWEARMSPTSFGSADVGLAGDEGVIGFEQQNPFMSMMGGMGGMGGGLNLMQMLPFLQQMMGGSQQQKPQYAGQLRQTQRPLQGISNGSLYGAAGNFGPSPAADISSFIG